MFEKGQNVLIAGDTVGPGESVADKAGWGGLSCAESGVMEQGERAGGQALCPSGDSSPAAQTLAGQQ